MEQISIPVEAADSPRARLRFTSAGLGETPFSPLAPPGTFELALHRVDPNLVERLHARFQARLRPGRWNLPLVSGEDLPVEVREGCRGRGWVRAERPRDPEPGETRVTSAEIHFDPPLVLNHIVPVLARLNSLFEDHELNTLLERMTRILPPAAGEGLGLLRNRLSTALRPRLDRLLPPGSPERARLHRLREQVQVSTRRLAEVHLRHVSATPVLRGDTWQLDLRFTGDFVVLGRNPVAFEDVHVPHLVIPYPHATLARLVSPEPLASATIRPAHAAAEDLLVPLASMLEGLEGTVEVDVDLPAVQVEGRFPDGASVEVGVRPPGRATVQGGFEVAVAPDRVAARVGELAVRLGEGALRLEGSVEAHRVEGAPAADPVATLLVRALLGSRLPPGSLQVEFGGRVLPGSRVEALDLDVSFLQPLLLGGARVGLRVQELVVSADGAVEVAPDTGEGRARHFAAQLSARVDARDDSVLDDGTTRLEVRSLAGDVGAALRLRDAAHLELSLRAGMDVDLLGRTRVETFPELDVEEGWLDSRLAGRVELDGRASTRETGEDLVELDFQGTRARVRLEEVRLDLPPRAFTLPRGTELEARVVEGTLDTSGLGRSRVHVAWDLQGRSPLLFLHDDPTVLFVPDLRQGEVDLSVSPVGGLSITGPERGLYDARYWNALLNPAREVRRWQELLESDEALDHVIATVRVFSADGARLLESLRRFARRGRAAVDAEEIRSPADLIPRDRMARVFSRLLVRDTSVADRIAPIIEGVTEGRGLDVVTLRRLLDDVLPPHDYTFELDRGLRWLDQVLSPTEPIRPPPVREELPLAERPAYRTSLRALPTAARIYEVLSSSERLPAGFSQAVARVAPYLTLEQVDWILARGRTDWRPADQVRLRHVQAIKRRTRMISGSYGGLGNAPQALAIGLFLGAAAFRKPLRGEVDRPLEGEPPGLLAHPACLLGPEDVAILLQAGLAAPVAWRQVQLNQRHLLDLVLAQPPDFLRQVLVEMSDGTVRILAGVLNALLGLEQGATRAPLDLVALFSERLGLELPRLSDYLAGGRYARHSYYEALNEKAARILEEAEPYRALCAWLQVVRQPPGVVVPEVSEEAQDLCRTAIARADELGRACTFRGREPTRRARARAAYELAFRVCADLLRVAPDAFKLPWFKAFWARNHEALTVLSVVRNVQEGTDRVREWFQVRAGHAPPASEQRLLDEVVDVLYDREEDRAALKVDPLVRLLLDPPEGRYRFTVVSAMGVVTDGARGEELAEAFARLEARRGIRVIRADTATARSLDFNAVRIEEAIRRVETPWGYVGYSQGCANGMWAESRLHGGTPDQQALLRGLRCRHLLCSALNGSAHGTAGDRKFLRAMIDGDRFLAHYQVVFSNRAIRVGLGLLRFVLDSEPFVATMGGVQSLSQEGVVALGREGQVKGRVPTTHLRGVIRPEIMPEALEFLTHVLTVQVGGDRHDSQVMEDEAVGHPRYVVNPQARVMAACDMGSRVQVTHHWSPLRETTDFITTTRDRERCVYDFPKDRHVFPWIEVNARFGLIDRDGEG